MVGRKEEIAALLSALNAKESQFVAIYGRRRVGKTYLVRETLSKDFCFEHVGPYGGSFADELDAFRQSLVKYGRAGCAELKSWREAFSELEKVVELSRLRRKVAS